MVETVKMNNLLIQVSFVTILKYCEAVPVPRHFGEKNTALFGVLTCILITAVVGMCVFCKKKKSQFQKFENDGNIEEVKNTEHPILKSLGSLELNRTCAIIPSSPTNLSTDNLLDQTVQYQNESVSSHEFDGIENYNLLQYQNQSSSNIQSGYHAKKNNGLCNEKRLELVEKGCGSNSNILLSSNEDSLSSSSTFLARKPNSSMDKVDTAVDSSDSYNAKPFVEHSTSSSGETDIEDNNGSCQVGITLKKPTRLMDVAISIDEKLERCEGHPSANAVISEAQEDVTPLDSLEDNSSSHETNSIEEALRALDYAINGEHESADSEDERNFVNYLGGIPEESVDSLHNEFCDEKHSSSDSGMEETETSDKNVSFDVSPAAIREEAKKLVDEILLLCQSRIEEIRECQKADPVGKSFQDDDFNDFNKNVLLDCSTPFVPKKISNVSDRNSITRQALFNTKNNETYTQSDNLMQETEHEEKRECMLTDFQIYDVTYQTGDNTAHKNDNDLEQIYPLKDSATFIAGNSFADPFETFIKNQSDDLPQITIESSIADDVLSDKSTATPMNTPIEPGYPTTADWDEWLSNSTSSAAACRELQLRESDDYFSSQTIDKGWFLHAQSENDEPNDETFDVGENDEVLDSTYDLLRKQLTEMLSFAQSAKEPSESYEENNANHYGIQYGDLDEASNAPLSSSTKDNELIINYKRTLSPIIEESEEESFYNKASFYKESSNYVESTSTGCMESLTAMGMNRTLMASNDTLFNFDEMLDEILSPRMSSQSHTPINRDREIPDYFLRSPRHDLTNEFNRKVDTLQLSSGLGINSQRTQDSLVSSPGDPTKTDYSQSSSTILDEKTCVSIGRPTEDIERISEISEPLLVSSTSCQNKHEENSLLDDEIPSIEDDSFNEILEKEKPLDNEQYFQILDLHGTEVESVLNTEPSERDENFDPEACEMNTGEDAVYLQNKLNLENTYNNRNQEAQVVIESIDRFLLKSRNMSLPEDKSTNSLVNGHLSSCKVSNRSDGKHVSVNHDK